MTNSILTVYNENSYKKYILSGVFQLLMIINDSYCVRNRILVFVDIRAVNV